MARCEPVVGKRFKATEASGTDEPTDFETGISSIIAEHFRKDMDKQMTESTKNEASEPGVIDIHDIPELFINDNPESGIESIDSEDAVSKVGTDDHLEEHPNLVPVEQTKNTSFNSSVLTEASVPARCNWEGEHCFKIKVDCPRNTKSETHSIFCESKNKLFISKDYPFKVLVSAVNVPPASVIRVYAAFCHTEDAYNIVQRCPTHAQQDYMNGIPAFEHVIQCKNKGASYEKSTSGRFSVSVPYWKPQSGETHSLYLYKLTCFNSCVGGINRRPYVLVFNLEKDGVTLGRQIIEARVCACPLRDFHSEMGKERNKKSADNNVPNLNSVETSQKFTISVKDPELYNFLMKMKSFYESSTYVKEVMNIDV